MRLSFVAAVAFLFATGGCCGARVRAGPAGGEDLDPATEATINAELLEVGAREARPVDVGAEVPVPCEAEECPGGVCQVPAPTAAGQDRPVVVNVAPAAVTVQPPAVTVNVPAAPAGDPRPLYALAAAVLFGAFLLRRKPAPG